MTKKKPLLLVYLLLSLVVFIVTVVLAFTVKIPLATDFGGGTQFEVSISSDKDVASYRKTIEKTLKKHGLSVERLFVEDKGIDSAIVVRMTNKGIKDSVREDIAKNLKIDLEKVGPMREFSGSVTKNAVLWAGVAIACLLLALFVAGWLRYNLMAGLTLVFTALLEMLLSISLLIICRVDISMMSVGVILGGVALTIFACALTLERLRENSRSRHNEGLSARELVEMSRNSTRNSLLFVALLIVVVALVLICTPVRFVTLTAITILLCLAAGAFSYYCVGTELHAYLLDIKMTRDKLRLTKNPDLLGGKKKAEKKEKTAEDKQKAKADKARDAEVRQRAQRRQKPKSDDPVV